MKALFFAVLGAAAIACSSTKTTYVTEPDPSAADAGLESGPSAEAGIGALGFRPATAYSGFDGTHAFTVPVGVYNAGPDLTVTADDATAADVVPTALLSPTKNGVTDPGKYFLVSMKRAGIVALTARANGQTATATITVTSYDADRWATGQQRYVNGEGGDPPCTDCHAGTAGIDHSPAALATVTDDAVGVIITTGVNPGGNTILIDGKPRHKWTVTDAELPGLVTYLRALAPKGYE